MTDINEAAVKRAAIEMAVVEMAVIIGAQFALSLILPPMTGWTLFAWRGLGFCLSFVVGLRLKLRLSQRKAR